MSSYVSCISRVALFGCKGCWSLGFNHDGCRFPKMWHTHANGRLLGRSFSSPVVPGLEFVSFEIFYVRILEKQTPAADGQRVVGPPPYHYLLRVLYHMHVCMRPLGGASRKAQLCLRQASLSFVPSPLAGPGCFFLFEGLCACVQPIYRQTWRESSLHYGVVKMPAWEWS